MNLLFLSAHPTAKLIKESRGKIDSLYRDDIAIIKGLRSVEGVNLDVLSSPDIASFPKLPLFIQGLYDEEERVHSLSVLNIPMLKQFWIIITLFLSAAKIIIRNGGITTIFIPYIVFHHAVPAYWLKRFFGKKVKLVTVVPDIFFPVSSLHKLMNRIAENCVKHSDAFVLYTQEMANYLGVTRKPYEVIEGFKDISEKKKVSINKVFKIVYTGSLNLKYGCGRLVESMSLISAPDVELHLYGEGTAVDMIKEHARKDSRIHFWGRVSKEEATNVLYSADVLINPRCASDGEYVAYSFPSKDIDYLGTGVPSILCKLPGMPKEYYGFFIDAGQGTPKELVAAINEVYEMDVMKRNELGRRAQAFIKNRMDTHVQGCRIVEMIKNNIL